MSEETEVLEVKKPRGRPRKQQALGESQLSADRDEFIPVKKKLIVSDAPIEVSPEAEYVISENRLDSFNVIRKLIEIGPEICRYCGFDICKKNELPSFKECSSILQGEIIEAMKQHVQVCVIAKRRPILASDRPKQWLSAEDNQKIRSVS